MGVFRKLRCIPRPLWFFLSLTGVMILLIVRDIVSDRSYPVPGASVYPKPGSVGSAGTGAILNVFLLPPTTVPMPSTCINTISCAVEISSKRLTCYFVIISKFLTIRMNLLYLFCIINLLLFVSFFSYPSSHTQGYDPNALTMHPASIMAAPHTRDDLHRREGRRERERPRYQSV